MKETKVYVDVEPRKIATQLVDLENEQFNCVILMFDTDVKPIEVIVEPKFKDHDQELVTEVCEEIRNRAVNMYYAEDQEDDSIEQAIVISRNEAVDEFIDILDQIQLEGENE